MTFGTNGDWLKENDYYSEEQVEAVLLDIGIEIGSETENVFMSYCPFHRNVSSPSFAINKQSGLFLCFSPACDERGSLFSLVQRITGKNFYQTKRLIDKYKSDTLNTTSRVKKLLEKQELPEFSQEVISRMADSLWNSLAHEYMLNRGFSDKTLAEFEIGYSAKKNLVAIPLHDTDGKPVGVIGRTLVGKRFENSAELPTGRTLFNLHRAKKVGDKIIIVESAMDAMRLWQLGYKNVVATCGGFFTDYHAQLINKYFNVVIIATDFDNPLEYINEDCKRCKGNCIGHNPGRALGEKIIKKLPNKRHYWASYDWHQVYPKGAKDLGVLADEEITQCIQNAVTAAEYEMWKRHVPLLAIV